MTVLALDYDCAAHVFSYFFTKAAAAFWRFYWYMGDSSERYLCLYVYWFSWEALIRKLKYRNVYNWFDLAFGILVEKLRYKSLSPAKSLLNWFIAEEH